MAPKTVGKHCWEVVQRPQVQDLVAIPHPEAVWLQLSKTLWLLTIISQNTNPFDNVETESHW